MITSAEENICIQMQSLDGKRLSYRAASWPRKGIFEKERYRCNGRKWTPNHWRCLQVHTPTPTYLCTFLFRDFVPKDATENQRQYEYESQLEWQKEEAIVERLTLLAICGIQVYHQWEALSDEHNMQMRTTSFRTRFVPKFQTRFDTVSEQECE